jgi:hypothetical protein
MFQNPDTLEPTNISPGANIAQELEQATIFQDTAEPRDEDKTGKSKEAYLPLNPSPTFALPSVRFVNMGSSSKDQEDEIRRREPMFGVPSLNPKEDYSPFSSSFAPMKRVLPIGLQTHKHTPRVEDEDPKHITDGGLKGEGPEKYQGNRDKAREFMRDFVLWWMMNKNNRAFQNPLSHVALFLGKMKGTKVTDWVSHMLREIGEDIKDDPSLEDNEILWEGFAEKFELKFTSASALEEVRQEFQECHMKDNDVDEYIAIFEDFLTKIDYRRSDFGVIEKFKHGLKKWIVSKILSKDKWPTTLEEWEEAARREVRRSKYIQTTLGDRKNFDMSLQEAKWRAALQIPEGGGKKPRQNNRRNNEVIPMEVDYASTQEQTPRLKRLTPDERKKLMDEGRCFKCRKKGHQSRQCPTKEQPSNPPIARNAETS